jgi:hypothetical protein
MYDDGKESEYLTILEMLEQMKLGKAIAVILGFYSAIGGIVLVFVYWLTRHR